MSDFVIISEISFDDGGTEYDIEYVAEDRADAESEIETCRRLDTRGRQFAIYQRLSIMKDENE